MTTTAPPILPFHFTWRSGDSTSTLAGALAALDHLGDDAAWHLAEGHLHEAMRSQGYSVLVEDLKTDAAELPQLRERVRIALELHKGWWDENDSTDTLTDTMQRLGKIFQKKGSELLDASCKQVNGFRNWLAGVLKSE